ncbi:hypothetical protein ACTGJ9_035605 [Bradyrhizobium sp. RDM12]
MEEDTHTIHSANLRATIKAHGAEMCSLKHKDGTEFVWQAGPAWTRHAPLLFPIVGRLANTTCGTGARPTGWPSMLCARQSFCLAERGESRCALVLEDSDATRALYAFAHNELRAPGQDARLPRMTLRTSGCASIERRKPLRAVGLAPSIPLRRRPRPRRRIVSQVLPMDVIARSDACQSSGKDRFVPFSVAAELVRGSNGGYPVCRTFDL